MRTLAQIFDWSDITADSEMDPRSRALTERNGDVFFFIHHAYNRLVQDTIALSKPGGKQVSENAAIGPTVAGAHSPIYCVQVVPWNTHRAYTTASSKDDIAFTTEVSNLDLNAPYPVAQAAKQLLAEIAAALHVEAGMPLDTWHICDHAEVYARGWGSYPTACCGPDLRAAIAWIINEAKRIVAEANTPERKLDMAKGFYLVRRVQDGHPALNAMTAAMGPGYFQHLIAGEFEGLARDLHEPADQLVDGHESGSNGLAAKEFDRLVKVFKIPAEHVKPGGSYIV